MGFPQLCFSDGRKGGGVYRRRISGALGFISVIVYHGVRIPISSCLLSALFFLLAFIIIMGPLCPRLEQNPTMKSDN